MEYSVLGERQQAGRAPVAVGAFQLFPFGRGHYFPVSHLKNLNGRFTSARSRSNLP